MNLHRAFIVVFVLITVTACATKRYPIATTLSPAETEIMTCSDLELEVLRADQIEQKINKTGDFDGRTVIGFLGDFGIGNGIAKDEARTSLSDRRITINEARVRKGCVHTNSLPQDQAIKLYEKQILGAKSREDLVQERMKDCSDLLGTSIRCKRAAIEAQVDKELADNVARLLTNKNSESEVKLSQGAAIVSPYGAKTEQFSNQGEVYKTKCTKCGNVVAYQEKYAGTTIKCMKCDNNFILP